MNIDLISPGKDMPNDINVVIEISANSAPIKYEFDKETGALCVDRFMGTSMFYPANYGFIPRTHCDDGDALDVLVLGSEPVVPASPAPFTPRGLVGEGTQLS